MGIYIMHEEYVVSFVQRLMIPPSNIREKHSKFNKYSHIHIQNTDICGDSLLGNTHLAPSCGACHNINGWICNLTTSVWENMVWIHAWTRKHVGCTIYILNIIHSFSQVVYLSHLYIWHPRDNEHQTKLNHMKNGFRHNGYVPISTLNIYCRRQCLPNSLLQ